MTASSFLFGVSRVLGGGDTIEREENALVNTCWQVDPQYTFTMANDESTEDDGSDDVGVDDNCDKEE